MPTYYPQLLRSRFLSDATRGVLAADDANVTDWHKGDKIILATQIGYNGKDTAAGSYRLDWRNVTDGGSFAAVAATGEIKWATASGVLADGTALTQANSRCTDPGNQTWQNGLENVGDNLLPDAGTIDLASDCFSEFQWALDISSALDGKQYEFRLWNLTTGATQPGTCIAKLTTKAVVAFTGVSALVTTTSSIALDITGGGVYNPVGVASVVSTTSTPTLLSLKVLAGSASIVSVTGSAGHFGLESGDLILLESDSYLLQELDVIDLEFGASLVGVAAVTSTTPTPILNVDRPLVSISTLITTTSSVDLVIPGSATLFGIAAIVTTSSAAILAITRPVENVVIIQSEMAIPTLVVSRELVGVGALASTTSSITVALLKSIPGVVSLDTSTNQPILNITRALDGTVQGSTSTSLISLFISGEASFIGLATIQSVTSLTELNILRNLFLSGVSVIVSETSMPVVGPTRSLGLCPAKSLQRRRRH